MAGIKVGEGYVEVRGDTSKLSGDVAKGQGAAKSSGMGVGKSIAGGIIGAYAAMGVAEKVTGWIGDAIMAGSDYNETISKGTAIFGGQMGAIQKWASTAATSTGLSTSAAVAAAASFGDMFSQIGFTGDQAAKMSTKVVQAAADLGSFSNLDTADVSERISAAFRGEYDSLQAVIPNISAARVEQEAMAKTGKTNASALTAQEKASAVLAIVQKDGNRAMGDFSRTSGGFANQMKIAAAQSEDLKGKIGGALQPALQAGAGVITGKVMPALLGLADKAVPVVANGVKTIGSVFGGMGATLSPVLGGIASAWGALWSGLGPALTPLFGIFASMVPQIMALASSFSPLGLIFKALLPVLPMLGSALGSIAQTIGGALLVAVQVLNPLITTLTQTLSGVFAAVLPVVVNLVMVLVGAFASLLPVATQIIGAIMQIITPLISMLVPIFTQLATAVLPIVASSIGMLVSAIGPLVTTILAVLMPVIRALLPVVSAVFGALVPIITSALRIIQGIIQVVTGIITGNWKQVWSGIQNIVGGVWGVIKGVIVGAINIVRSVIVAGLTIISGIFRTVWSAASSAVSGATNAIIGFVTRMAAGIGTGISNAVSFFTGLGGKIMSAVSGFGSLLVSVGRNTIEGFINGAKAVAGKVLDAVTAPIKNAINGAKSLLGIHSPSRVFRQIGDYVGQGLVLGLKGQTDKVRQAGTKMSRAVMDSLGAKDISERMARGALAAISSGTNRLATLASRRSSVADRLAAANKKLTATQKTYNDYQKSVLQSVGNFSITGAKSGEGIITLLTKQVAKVKDFTKTMTALRKAGLDKNTFQQLVAAGPDSLPLASSLLAGGKDQIKKVASLQGQLAKSSSTFASQAATSLYGAGVQAAKGLVNGLSSQQKAIGKQMDKIARSMTSSIKRALGIHSPSRVFRWVGEMTGRGLIVGMKGITPQVTSAASALVAPIRSVGTGVVAGGSPSAPGGQVGAGSNSATTNNVTVNMNAVTSDPAQTARAAAREILERLK